MKKEGGDKRDKVSVEVRVKYCTAWQDCILKHYGECKNGCSYYKPPNQQLGE